MAAHDENFRKKMASVKSPPPGYEHFWKTLEIAGEEVVRHPNVDPVSFELWRQSGARKKQGTADKMLQELRVAKQQKIAGILNLQDNIASAERDDPMAATWRREKKGLARQMRRLQERQAKLAEEKGFPHIFDSLVSEEFSRTIVNPDPVPCKKPQQEGGGGGKDDPGEKKAEDEKFVEENEALIKDFGWLSRLEDTHGVLSGEPRLVSEAVVRYLCEHCVGLAMEKKESALEHVANQVVLLVKILKLASAVGVTPEKCTNAVMQRLKVAKAKEEKKSARAPRRRKRKPKRGGRKKKGQESEADEEGSSDEDVEDEVEAAEKDSPLARSATKFSEGVRRDAEEFVRRIRGRAERELDRMRGDEEAKRDMEESIKVLDSLPESLRRCFEERDAARLRRTVSSMRPDEAEDLMRRCVEAGLWRPSRGAGGTSMKTGLVKLPGEADEEEDGEAAAKAGSKRVTEYPSPSDDQDSDEEQEKDSRFGLED